MKTLADEILKKMENKNEAGDVTIPVNIIKDTLSSMGNAILAMKKSAKKNKDKELEKAVGEIEGQRFTLKKQIK